MELRKPCAEARTELLVLSLVRLSIVCWTCWQITSPFAPSQIS